MTKIDGRTKDAAAQQIDESLQRLQTDHIDLLQFHEIIRLEDPDRIFADGGGDGGRAGGARRRARSASSASPATRTRRSTCACWRSRDQHGFRFDAVQMPLNVMDAHFRSFGQQGAAGAGEAKASACWA